MSEAVPTIVVILLVATLMLLIVRRLRAGAHYSLRPLDGFLALGQQTGQAVESGRQVHVTLGRAPLAGINGPTSVAALEVLGYLAQESSESGISPKVTLGDATLLPAAKGEVHRAHVVSSIDRDDVQFLADTNFPLAYAAGVTNAIHHDEIASNVAVGRFGAEVALIAEAARRDGHEQIIGTDDPTALALATLYSENVLWGEELFAAGAYLEGNSAQVASVRTQDILRWLVAGTILLITLLRIVGLL